MSDAVPDLIADDVLLVREALPPPLDSEPRLAFNRILKHTSRLADGLNGALESAQAETEAWKDVRRFAEELEILLALAVTCIPSDRYEEFLDQAGRENELLHRVRSRGGEK